MIIWAVSQRLMNKMRRKGKIDLVNRIKAKMIKLWSKLGDRSGIFYVDEDDKIIYFASYDIPNWWNCIGFLPFYMEEPDPYQPIPEGDVKEWFIKYLKSKGFEEIKEVSKDERKI